MKTFIKAALSASALLIANQAYAADFILSSNPSNTNQSFKSYFQLAGSDSTGAAANLGNGPTTLGSFSDRFFFVPTLLNAVGSGSATSNQTFNLDFLANLGLTITGYSLAAAPANVAAALTDAFTSANYSGDLSVLTSYLSTNPAVAYSQTGVKTPQGNGSQVQLSNVTLSSANFYVITVSGEQKNLTLGRYDGNVSFTAVPEPATWAMLLAGFGVVGFAMRRRNVSQAVKVSFG